MAVLAVAILAASVSVANTLKIGGTGIALGGMSRLGTAFEELNPGTNIIVLPSLGSSGGIKALLAGATDIGLSSRELNNAEREAGALTQIYAYTPLAVVTSPDSKIDGVTTQDLEAIYSGTMTHWPDGSLVRIVMRPASETDTALLRTLSEPMAMAVDSALQRPGLVSATNDQENAETLEKLPGSIGLVALGQIAAEGRVLKVLSLNGELPKLDHDFKTESSFAKTLYLVSRQDMSPLANEFIQFVFSAEGRKILVAIDHSPVQ
tara:strand:- start:1752 stop:2543 length:792 start_codon:yes stop_codon:yes gene_type:complete